MAGVSPPTGGSTLAVVKPQEVKDNNSKSGWFSLIFSNEGLREVRSSYLLLCGKVMLAGVCLIITDPMIDRFSPQPYRTALKVIVVVATIGFFIYLFISLKKFIESVQSIIIERNEQIKENKRKDEELDCIISDAESVITNHYELSVDGLGLFSEYEKRVKLWEEKKTLIDSIEKIKSVQDCVSRMSELTQQIIQINATIRSEIVDETLPKDYEEVVQIMPAETEQQSKLLEARSQRLILLRGMIACYDELFKKIDQFKAEKNG